MLVQGGNLNVSPGDILEQDVCRAIRQAELRLIHDVMKKFRGKGMRSLSREEKVVFREIADLEFDEKQRTRA